MRDSGIDGGRTQFRCRRRTWHRLSAVCFRSSAASSSRLAVWWLKRESVFVDRHARASINFQLSMTLYYGLALGYVYVYVGFGLALLLASGVFETISMVLAARRAKAGKYYQYRMCLQFLKHRRDAAP